jgi:hypothetical protein
MIVTLLWTVVAYVLSGWFLPLPIFGPLGVLLTRVALALWRRYPSADDFILEALGWLVGIYIGYAIFIATWFVWGIPQ